MKYKIMGWTGIGILFVTFLYIFLERDRREKLQLYMKEQTKKQQERQQEKRDRHYISLNGLGSHF